MLYDQHGVYGAQFNGIEQVGFLFSSCNGTQDAGVSRISRTCVRQRRRGRTAGARAPPAPRAITAFSATSLDLRHANNTRKWNGTGTAESVRHLSCIWSPNASYNLWLTRFGTLLHSRQVRINRFLLRGTCIIVLICKAFRQMRLSCIDTLVSLTRVLRVTDRNSIFRRTAT